MTIITLFDGLQAGVAAQEDTPTSSTAASRFDLWGDLGLSDPVFLALVPVVLGALWLGRTRRRTTAGRVPALPGDPLPRTAIQRLCWLPRALKAMALVLVILALARPLRGDVEFSTKTEGVDIVLLVDRSSSMDAQETRSAPTRFEIVKEVVADFARRRMTDREGAADNICFIAFALYPELLCPFTLDADALEGVFDSIETEKRRELDATGIGVALAKSVAVLEGSEAQSRIVVLLTDGRENVHAIEPMDAARLAAETGIKVYTVFAGPRYEVRMSLLGGRTEIPIDTTELKSIAELTGARFYHAESKSDLEACYAEIEQLERTEREESRFAQHFDLYPRLLLPSFVLYLLAWLFASTWARRLP